LYVTQLHVQLLRNFPSYNIGKYAQTFTAHLTLSVTAE